MTMPRSSLAAAAAPAFDAHPSDVVLIKSYVRPWVAQGVCPPGGFVHVVDLYAAAPDDLARSHSAAVARDGECVWYFLSPLRTKSPRGRRKSRTVKTETGTGWWNGEAGPKAVLDPLDGHRKVGYRQSFSFMRRGADGAPVRTGWIMLELHLHDDEDGGGGIRDQLEGLVLCKVYRSPRHLDTAAATPDDGDEESCVAAAAPAGRRHSIAADGEGIPDAPLVLAVAPGGKRKAGDDEGYSPATPGRHVKNAEGETSGAAAAVMTPGIKKQTEGGENEVSGAATSAAPGIQKQAADGENQVSGAATSAAPGLKKKAAGDDGNEIYGATTAAVRGNEEGKRAVDDDEDSSASRERMAADDEGPGAASALAVAPALTRKAAVVDLAPATQQLLCPQCGFHIGALKAAVAPGKSTPETGTRIAQAGAPQEGGRSGDASGKDPSTYRLHLRFSDPKQA